MVNAYPIYLDYNATTPCDPRVVDVMLPFFTTHFGNAASKSHAYGWYAEEAVAMAREQVAALIGADPQEIIFTSGATESVNLAIRGFAEANRAKGKHIITVATEHKAVLEVCEYLASIGFDLTVLPVDTDGMIYPQQVEAAMRSDTILLAAMYANNETGVVFPIPALGALAKERGIAFFTDATQAIGKIPVQVEADGIDMMAFSGHKLYGPKGVGCLYVRKKKPKVEIFPLQYGGGHERKMRSGTLNVPGIVGLGKAVEICQQEMSGESVRLATYRDQLVSALTAKSTILPNATATPLLPHVANLCFNFAGGDQLVRKLSKNLAISSGSACSSVSVAPSHVLKAMGLSDDEALSSIRFSLGRFTTAAELEQAIQHVLEACPTII
jgi:cysteine desulfurase